MLSENDSWSIFYYPNIIKIIPSSSKKKIILEYFFSVYVIWSGFVKMITYENHKNIVHNFKNQWIPRFALNLTCRTQKLEFKSDDGTNLPHSQYEFANQVSN